MHTRIQCGTNLHDGHFGGCSSWLFCLVAPEVCTFAVESQNSPVALLTDQSVLWAVQQGAPTRTALPAACYHSLHAFARTLQTAFERESLYHWSTYWRVLRSGPKPPAGPVELIAGGAYASRARGSSDTAHRSVSPSLADLCICTSSISISFVFYSYKAIIKVGRFTVSGISL